MMKKYPAHICKTLRRSSVPVAITFLLIFYNSFQLSAQVQEDTLQELPQTVKVKKGSIFSGRPGKALLMSLVVPGAGQIYNKSYWRAPIVWGAVGTMGYILLNNTQQYNCFRDAYVARIDGKSPLGLPKYCDKIPFTNIEATLLEGVDASIIRRYRDDANTYRQWSIVGFAAVWLLNGVDAFVDAHLKDFDIDEDLSIDIGPKIENDPFAPMKVGIFVQF